MRAEHQDRNEYASRKAGPASLNHAETRNPTLQSWKEIASELNRGVRTVQRWERDLKLPVRRIGKGPRSPVFAFKGELDRWLRSSVGMRVGATEGSLQDLQRKEKSSAELLQALENLFAAKPAKHAKCSDCGSSMQFLKGQFWIYGSSRKRSVSVPFCPECNSDTRHAFGRDECIQ